MPGSTLSTSSLLSTVSVPPVFCDPACGVLAPNVLTASATSFSDPPPAAPPQPAKTAGVSAMAKASAMLRVIIVLLLGLWPSWIRLPGRFQIAAEATATGSVTVVQQRCTAHTAPGWHHCLHERYANDAARIEPRRRRRTRRRTI